jgi:sterol 14-demethylase
MSHLKAMVSSLTRGVNRTVALERYACIARKEARKIAIDWAEQPDIEIICDRQVCPL